MLSDAIKSAARPAVAPGTLVQPVASNCAVLERAGPACIMPGMVVWAAAHNLKAANGAADRIDCRAQSPNNTGSTNSKDSAGWHGVM